MRKALSVVFVICMAFLGPIVGVQASFAATTPRTRSSAEPRTSSHERSSAERTVLCGPTR